MNLKASTKLTISRLRLLTRTLELKGPPLPMLVGITHMDMLPTVERLPGFIYTTQRGNTQPLPYEFGVVENVVIILTPKLRPVAGSDDVFPFLIISREAYLSCVTDGFDISRMMNEDQKVCAEFFADKPDTPLPVTALSDDRY